MFLWISNCHWGTLFRCWVEDEHVCFFASCLEHAACSKMPIVFFLKWIRSICVKADWPTSKANNFPIAGSSTARSIFQHQSHSNELSQLTSQIQETSQPHSWESQFVRYRWTAIATVRKFCLVLSLVCILSLYPLLVQFGRIKMYWQLPRGEHCWVGQCPLDQCSNPPDGCGPRLTQVGREQLSRSASWCV